LNFRRDALAVVLEISLRPLREFQILVPLAPGVREKRLDVVLDLGPLSLAAFVDTRGRTSASTLGVFGRVPSGGWRR
jgi:hypothetical protein